MDISFKDAFGRQLIQRMAHKIIGKAIRAALYSEFSDIVAQVQTSSISIEQLQPHGWKMNIRMEVLINPFDGTRGIPRPPVEPEPEKVTPS